MDDLSYPDTTSRDESDGKIFYFNECYSGIVNNKLLKRILTKVVNVREIIIMILIYANYDISPYCYCNDENCPEDPTKYVKQLDRNNKEIHDSYEENYIERVGWD